MSMRGLRVKESRGFETFFSLLQLEVAKKGCVFFLDHVEGKEEFFQDMECNDLHGWLLPISKADKFEPLFLTNDEKQWDFEPFLYVDFKIVNDKIEFIIEEV